MGAPREGGGGSEGEEVGGVGERVGEMERVGEGLCVRIERVGGRPWGA